MLTLMKKGAAVACAASPFILALIVSVLVLASLQGCASPDDVTKGADAAARAGGGGAESATGQKKVGANVQYSSAGDNDRHDLNVEAHRDTSATKAGDVYTGVQVAAGGGAAALQAAIEADPLVRSLRGEIDELAQTSAESRPTARLDELRLMLAARLKEIGDAAARSQPSITVTGTTVTVTAPSQVGAPPPPLTEADAKTVGELPAVLEAGKTKPPQ